MSGRVEELNCTQGSQRDARGGCAPPILVREDQEEHHRLHEAGKDERVAKADEIGAKKVKRGRVEEVDVTGVHILHLDVQRFAFENPLRDVGIVTFVRRIPAPVVEGVEEGRGRQQGATAATARFAIRSYACAAEANRLGRRQMIASTT